MQSHRLAFASLAACALIQFSKSPTPEQNSLLRVQHLEITDGEGRVCASMKGENGQACLQFFRPDCGEKYKDQPIVRLGADTNGDPHLSLNSLHWKTSADLRITGHPSYPSAVFVDADGIESLRLSAKQGEGLVCEVGL